MARRRSKSPKRSSADKTGSLQPALRREIIAIALFALTLLLLFAFLGRGGYLLEWLLNTLEVLMGTSVYLLPFLLIFTSARLFIKEEHDLGIVSFIGMALIIFSVSGVAHLGYTDGATFAAAADGRGGGYIGALVAVAMQGLLVRSASTIVLLSVFSIGLVLLFNVRLSDLFRRLLGLLRREREPDEFGEIAARAKTPKMTINAKVALGSAEDFEAERVREREAPPVLIGSSDPDWEFPPLDLVRSEKGKADVGDPTENAEIIKGTLAEFGIDVEMTEVNIGPAVTQYTLKPPSGVKLSRISELESNIALNLSAKSIRIEAPIPGKNAVGIEVPNRKPAIVRMRPMLESEEWKGVTSQLSFVLGQDVSGQVAVADLDRMPHLLVAGATNSGKSVMINSFLLSLLYRNSPSDLRLILIDPKYVELAPYQDIPHLLSPVISEVPKCLSALRWAIAEMERRYQVFLEGGSRDIAEYNKEHKDEEMPYIVIVIDELNDFMQQAGKELEHLIVRIAQKARATGIHLVIATQRPDVKVITGVIKANIPGRMAFRTNQNVDSRTILDKSGAEKLLGSGDMLFVAPDSAFVKGVRIQGVLVETKEVKDVTEFLRNAREPDYNEDVLTQTGHLGGGGGSTGYTDGDEDDPLYVEAKRTVIERGEASTSYLQRRLRVGYARAARLIDMLEEHGIVSSPDSSHRREVLVTSLDEFDEENPAA